MASEKKPKAAKKTSAELAAEAAEKIRIEMSSRQNISAGSIINGDLENWHYVHCPAEDKSQTLRMEAKLKSRGYVPCEDSESMVGQNTGRLWKIPAVIHKERMADRHKRILARKKHGASAAARIS